MMKDSYAGCCYLCGNYVGMGAGEVLKNRVAGQRHSLRCLPCGLTAEKPSATPTEAVLSENAAALLRQSVRGQIRRLLDDNDMPPEKVRAGQAWLESQQWPIEKLHKVHKQLLTMLTNIRNGRPLAA